MGFRIEASPEIQHRDQFADLCNARKLLRAVEVGTDRGAFAATFLRRWKGEILWCVDPYEPYPHMPWDRESDRLLAIAHLAEFAARVRFLRATSVEAARLVSGHAIEFAYIDGAHDFESVSADLEAWWGRLYPKGPTILAGHDFDKDHQEVVDAVTRFAKEKSAIVRHTVEGDGPPSWYVYRNEPEHLCRFQV